MTEQNCEKCRYYSYFVDDDIDGFGMCRKYAPRPFVWHSQAGDGHGYHPETLWPLTHRWAWCGEWQERTDD